VVPPSVKGQSLLCCVPQLVYFFRITDDTLVLHTTTFDDLNVPSCKMLLVL